MSHIPYYSEGEPLLPGATEDEQRELAREIGSDRNGLLKD